MKNVFYILFLLRFIFADSLSYAAEIRVNQKSAIKSIDQALALAEAGDTIIIDGGIYKEGNVLITKSIALIGINNPIIDGEGKNEIFSVQASNVLIQGITFQNVGISSLKDNAAIRIIKSKHCVVRKNTLLNTFFGIYLENSDSCTIENNIIKGQAVRETTSGNAIHLWYSKNVTIRNNHVSGHRDGIYLEFVEGSGVHGNKSQGNLRYGLHFMFSNDNVYTNNQFIKNGAGVAVMYSKRIEMTNNTFKDNEGAAAYGILLKDIVDSRIEKNNFEKNTTGIFAEGSNRLVIKNNNFIRNGWAVKIMGSCESLDFTGNNFIGNTFDMSVSSKNISGHLLKKNFWSSYSGYDLDKDGIGDVPHRPVRLFSYLIEQVPTAIVLIRSLFIDLLELAEKVTPSLTPANLVDEKPRMAINHW